MRSIEHILEDAKTLYDFHSETDTAPIKTDIILVAGSHDLRVPDYAAKLFLDGIAPVIVCSGGLGKITDGLWSEPEGDVFAQRCISCGVPKGKIIVERTAKNTGDNFSFSRKLLSEIGITPNTGTIVCKPYMAKRAWATGTKQWSTVRWVSRVPDISFEDYWDNEDSLKRDIELMVGDLQRLVVYAEKGFQVPVDVPESIWAAYLRLVEDGFDRFVIK